MLLEERIDYLTELITEAENEIYNTSSSKLRGILDALYELDYAIGDFRRSAKESGSELDWE